jgi:hypothetical protein
MSTVDVSAYMRRPFIKKSGTRVKSAYVRKHKAKGLKRSGRSRGIKSRGPFSASKGYRPWITKKGALGGPGFMSKPRKVQYELLDRCVSNDGYKTCLGRVMVLNKSKSRKTRKYSTTIKVLTSYLKKHYSPRKHLYRGLRV